jgi:hypothetical protein
VGEWRSRPRPHYSVYRNEFIGAINLRPKGPTNPIGEGVLARDLAIGGCTEYAGVGHDAKQLLARPVQIEPLLQYTYGLGVHRFATAE